MARSRRGWFAGFVAASLLLALAPRAAFAQAAQPKPLLVFAAASLKNALDVVDARLEQDKGVKVLASYAASSTLAKQIEAGAPADVFISADLDWMDYLARKNLIKPQTRANLLGNDLVLIAPSDSAATAASASRLSTAATMAACSEPTSRGPPSWLPWRRIESRR